MTGVAWSCDWSGVEFGVDCDWCWVELERIMIGEGWSLKWSCDWSGVVFEVDCDWTWVE